MARAAEEKDVRMKHCFAEPHLDLKPVREEHWGLEYEVRNYFLILLISEAALLAETEKGHVVIGLMVVIVQNGDDGRND